MSSSSREATGTFGPIDPGRRIEAVDMVRGFALFGVLLVNMYNFGASADLWTAQIDKLAFATMRVLFETKSWRLFSFLFGFGFALQLLRAQERGARFWPVYLRRLVVLFVIGMFHAPFYDGDILMYYAELGLILAVFRRLPPKLLLGLAALLLMVFPIERAVTSLGQGVETVTLSADERVEQSRARFEELRQTHPYSVGSLRDVMAANSHLIPPNPFTDLRGAESSLAFFAMFLLGLYAGRRRILHDISGHMVLIRRVLWWGLGIGLLAMASERILNATVGYEVFSQQGASLLPQLAGDLLFTYGSTALSLGYAAAVVVLARHGRWRRMVAPFGPVGRLALTVYLTQTLMFTTLFYGYGFGQVFRIGPAAVTGYALLFFAIQIVACAWWVRRFRIGPMEWLWRSLTYLRLQPIRPKV